MIKYKLLRTLSARIEAIDAILGTSVSATEMGYLDGVTSAIQTQLNAKAPAASPTFTGTVVLPTAVSAPSLPVAADNAAAVTAGLAVGKLYNTVTGEVRVVV